MSDFSGQCMCGDVKYEGTGEPAFTGNCHCSSCRATTGAVYATNVFFNKSDIKITGKTSTYPHKADSGHILTNHFCQRCGSQVYVENDARSTLIGLRAGCLNQHEIVKPQVNVYASSKVATTPLDADIPAFEKMPG